MENLKEVNIYGPILEETYVTSFHNPSSIPNCNGAWGVWFRSPGKVGNKFMTSGSHREIESRFSASETDEIVVLLAKIRSTVRSRCEKDTALCFQHVEAGMPVNTQANMSHRQPELRSGVWERCWH